MLLRIDLLAFLLDIVTDGPLDNLQVDPIQRCQPCVGSLRFGYGRGVSGSRAERRRYPDQLFIEHYDRVPLNPAAPARRIGKMLATITSPFGASASG
jgi:hypothetical protein